MYLKSIFPTLFAFGVFIAPSVYAETDAQLLAKGQWRDSGTGLIWMRCILGQKWTGSICSGKVKEYTWWDALRAADTLNFSGQSDWRLPSIYELSTLLKGTVIKGEDAYPNMPFANFLPFSDRSDAEKNDIRANLYNSDLKGYKSDFLIQSEDPEAGNQVLLLSSSSAFSPITGSNTAAWGMSFVSGGSVMDKSGEYVIRLVRAGLPDKTFTNSLDFVRAGDAEEALYKKKQFAQAQKERCERDSKCKIKREQEQRRAEEQAKREEEERVRQECAGLYVGKLTRVYIQKLPDYSPVKVVVTGIGNGQASFRRVEDGAMAERPCSYFVQ